MSTAPADTDGSDYFAIKPTPAQAKAKTQRASFKDHSRTDFDQDVELRNLHDDAMRMSRSGAGRWRKVAITMPKGLWKADDDATTCDHLFLGGACEKPFGRFVGRYRLPTFSAWSPLLATHSEASEACPTSALWGSIKINRRNHCWRCGNCFCDDHSGHFATLILDAKDAPASVAEAEEPSEVDTPYVEEAPETATDNAVDPEQYLRLAQHLTAQSQTTHQESPEQLENATLSLAQLLSSEERVPASAAAQARQQHLQRAQLASTASSSSHHSDDWYSVSGGSQTSTSRSRGIMPSASIAASGADADPPAPWILPSMDATPTATAPYSLPASLHGGDSPRGSEQQLTPTSPRASSVDLSSVSSRITMLPDGRYLVRERVCGRCHNIVEQAKARAIQKQTLREEQQAQINFALGLGADMATVARANDPRRSSEPTAESREQQEHLASLQRLYDEYRRSKRLAAAATRSTSVDAVGSRARMSSTGGSVSSLSSAQMHRQSSQPHHPPPLAPPPTLLRRSRSSTWGKVPSSDNEEEEDDEDEDADSYQYPGSRRGSGRRPADSHRLAFHTQIPHAPGYPSQNKPRQTTPLPQYGMGGQRLQIAWSRYQ